MEKPSAGKYDFLSISVVRNGYKVTHRGTEIPWVFVSFEAMIEWVAAHILRGEE